MVFFVREERGTTCPSLSTQRMQENARQVRPCKPYAQKRRWVLGFLYPLAHSAPGHASSTPTLRVPLAAGASIDRERT